LVLWGRVIFYHSDVDALHANVIAAGYAPSKCLNCDIARAREDWAEGIGSLALFGTKPEDHIVITGQKLKRATRAPYDPYAIGLEPSLHRAVCSDAAPSQSPSGQNLTLGARA
jgi:hypothetical protein